MKITIVTAGSRGDVQPYIALAIGLKNSGHNVRIATHANFRGLADENGIELIELAGNPQEILDTEYGKKMVELGENPLIFVPMMLNIYKTYLKNFLNSLLDVCQDSEALIFSITTYPCYYIAKKMNIPCFAAYLLPFNSTTEFQNIFIPNPHRFGSLFNKMSHLMIEQLLWQPIRTMINNWITKELKIAPIPFTGNSDYFKKSGLPFIYGFSEAIVKKPNDWDKFHYITGYWFLNQHDNWEPSKELTDFLEDGKLPVYIGFGSMNNRNPEQVADMVIKSLNSLGEKGILLSGWGGLKKSDLPDNILMVNSIPHDWLFPKMAAVVHHCGAGTTGAGLKAGVPTIPVPFFADQYFWGHRLYDLGIASKPIPRKNLSSENLSKALKDVIGNKFIKERALDIAEKVKNENGVTKAVKIINNYLGV